MKTDKLEKIGVLCFWLAFVIELLIVMVDKSAYINPIEGQLFRITFLLCCVKIATTRYSRDEWLCILFFGAVMFVSYLINERDETVRIVAFIAACKGVDLKKMLQLTFWFTFAGIVLLFILSITGIYGVLTVTANFGRGPFPGIVETRYCFGMGHPNAFQCMIFMASTLLLCMEADRMKFYHFILLAFVNFLAYRYTDSNTAFLVMLAVIGGILLLKYSKPLRRWWPVYVAAALFVLIIVFFSVIGSHIGRETPFMYELDQILNGRFQYAHLIENARVENWKLFALAENTEYFDAGFIRLFYWYGIIPGAVYVFINLYLIYWSFQKEDYTIVVIVAGYTLFTIMEAHLISVYILRNYLFLLLGYYWYQPFAAKGQYEGYFWQVKKLLMLEKQGDTV